MPSLLVVVFVLQLLLHIVNTVGANTINELLWILYNKFPTPTSNSAQKAQALKKEVVRLKRELGAVSAQDDFARWAKLQRQHDKAFGDFQKLDASLRSHQTTFTSTVSTLRWLGTQGLRFILQFWFSKSPMFWIPAGWVPYYAEWILSFPRAPLGSVSINIWGIACASVIALVGEALTAAYVLATRKPAPTASKQEEPMAHKARPAAKQEAKKEL
ncbi:CHD5-domain-containing protein [Corynespora cassiicola Philippines]|uniref:CHD5-domain-containing protein n=1 Tax=Corynespora cassiicola Philippines TaxID=1448308 RepID=A0A2T2NT85_CORCC|nr:CHD5-domain-containing protein [Corynespora cassiicola Philippines]